MPETTRDTWETPALLVFTRNKPEEAVLTACKNQNGSNCCMIPKTTYELGPS